MPDLLLELFSEEIPARMQAQAAADLQRLVTGALVEAGLVYEGAKAFATPRRLALHVAGLPPRQPDTREERKGPRVGAPEGAIQGFLKSARLSSIADAKVVQDLKKGSFYVAVIERPGQATPDVIAAVMPGIIRAFPWPRSMRWGRGSSAPEALRWVRPLQSILCTFGAETEEPEVVSFAVDGIASGDTTRGHRFMAPEPFRVKRFDDYVPALDRSKVVLDAERRADIVRHDARDLAFARGLEVVEDEALLAEVAGLVEWPVVLMGRFDADFLKIPPEVIRATIRANQKCFVTRRPDGALAENFVLVSNILAPDGGAAIVAGNERVVRARLSDARFFWETDLGVRLEDRLSKLDAVVFHEKLGTQGERIRRIAALARAIAPQVGADAAEAERAALLAKADLGSEMVGEFPELQGLMGRYYAEAQGEVPAVAAAIEGHYRPQGPSDRVPSEPISIAVALADKLDTLVGFWAIDEKPTGSKDPYALRRAALGVIRVLLECKLRFALNHLIFLAFVLHVGTTRRTVCLAEDLRNISMDETVHPLDILANIERKSPLEHRIIDFDHLITRAVPVWWDIMEGDFGASSESYRWYRDAKTSRAYYVDDEEDVGIGDTVLLNDEENREISAIDASLRKLVPARISEIILARKLVDSIPWPDKDLELWPDGGDDSSVEQQNDSRGLIKTEEDRRRTHADGVDETKLPTVAAVVGEIRPSLMTFFADRLKVYLREKGARHDLIDAIFALPGQDDLVTVVRRVEALERFLETQDGSNLLTGYRRAANILKAEEKHDGAGAFDGPHDPALLSLPEERALADALAHAGGVAAERVAGEDFEGAMRVLAALRAPVDAFFERVTVNADAPALRTNRLRLLAALRRTMMDIADFGRIAG